MRLFLDTSALAKLFVEELGTPEITARVAASGGDVWVSELAPVEFHSVLWRRHREGIAAADAVSEMIDLFDEQALRWHVVPLGNAQVVTARRLLAEHARTHGLRALDALQLGAFVLLREDGPAEFACADARLCAVAQARGEAIFNPLATH